MTIFSIWKQFQFRKRINNRNHYSRLQAHKVQLFVTTGSKFNQGWETGSYYFKFRVKRNVSSISTGHLSEVFEKGKPPKSVSLPRKVIFTEEDMKQLSPQTSLGHSTGPELLILPDITGLSGRKNRFSWLVGNSEKVMLDQDLFRLKLIVFLLLMRNYKIKFQK